MSFAFLEQTSITSKYRVLGAADTCAQICYRLGASANFVQIFLQSTPSWTSPQCILTGLYVRSLGVTFGLSPSPPRALLTMTATFNQSTSVVTTSTYVRVVTAAASCVFSLCNSVGVCDGAAASNYTDGRRVLLDTNYFAYIHVPNADSYVLCVGADTSTLAPVALNNGTYVWNVGGADPAVDSVQFAPTTLRSQLGNNQLLFTSVGGLISPTTDVVRALAVTSLLADTVCPPEGAASTLAQPLQVVFNTSASTSTFAVLAVTGFATLAWPSTDIAFCYYYDTTSRRAASYLGKVTPARAIPSSYLSTVTTTGNASMTVTLIGTSAVSMLTTTLNVSPASSNESVFIGQLNQNLDSIRFYADNPGCVCDRFTCDESKLVTMFNPTFGVSGTVMRIASTVGFTHSIAATSTTRTWRRAARLCPGRTSAR
jgi:hypothetical protein